ncbi:MAG: cell division FtsA domain-containing protein [Candidatus Caccovivens sp.]
MARDCVTVVEIGSSKLNAVVAQRGVNGIFNIKAKASIQYAGFFEGEFIEKALLEDAVKTLFASLQSVYKKPITKIFVGVPAEFSKVTQTSAQLNFRYKHSVSQKDIETLKNEAADNVYVEGMEVLSASPIYFTLDDNRKTNDPTKLKVNKISAEISIILAQSSFINLFNKIWTRLGIEQVEYLSEPLCEAMFVVDKVERERTCIVIDVGARSTSVAFVKGDGLTNLTSFSMGGSYITSDLSEACGISYQDASALKRQIVLSLQGGKDDFYELATLGGKVLKIPLSYANEAVCYRLELIATTVNECIRLFAKEYVPYYPIYLCGAGLSKIKGGKDFFAKCIGRNIAYGVPPIPAMDKPEHSSLLGLLNMALDENC